MVLKSRRRGSSKGKEGHSRLQRGWVKDVDNEEGYGGLRMKKAVFRLAKARLCRTERMINVRVDSLQENV
ncbi:hypothetical protein L1987_47582 [Smallanthus sonchifolius]|uniref:Uncharacterized protein n=1 Tax=Smallanthus sonchifolius TaxID=185202 RepID=A0ACB9G319_9ASTR|nr:hypothetical protein L1987_47582 [Smallanthus sonchifolius]